MLNFSEHTSSMKTVKSIDQLFQKNPAKAASTFPIKFLLLVSKIIKFKISKKTQSRKIKFERSIAKTLAPDQCTVIIVSVI